MAAKNFIKKGSISIHAPRVGSDDKQAIAASFRFLFQSTLPVWGATAASIEERLTRLISIHAPRVGSDQNKQGRDTRSQHFNPRSPCGERRFWGFSSAGRAPDFNPRSPCGERRMCIWISGIKKEFQSTLPVWGATEIRGARLHHPGHFNPRSPCGERRAAARISRPECRFQSTLPVWGATVY